MVIESAKASVKGIYREKAMACSLAECDEMIQVCEAHNVVLAINHQSVGIIGFLQLKSLLVKEILVVSRRFK